MSTNNTAPTFDRIATIARELGYFVVQGLTTVEVTDAKGGWSCHFRHDEDPTDPGLAWFASDREGVTGHGPVDSEADVRWALS